MMFGQDRFGFRQIVAGSLRTGIEPERFAKFGCRLCNAIQTRQRDAETVVGHRKIWLELHRLLKKLPRFLEVPALQQGGAEIVAGFQVPGIRLQGHHELGDGAVEIALLFQRQAEIEMRDPIARIALQAVAPKSHGIPKEGCPPGGQGQQHPANHRRGPERQGVR